jgi:AcrR family transcriptional regulator
MSTPESRRAMSSREKLIDATLELLGQYGYRGTTTKAIAERAGLSEVTLFRQFGSKAELTATALSHASRPFREAVLSPSEDLTGDLVAVASGYVEFVDEWPALIDRVLPEIAGDPGIDHKARSLIADNVAATTALIDHHKRAGRLVEVATADIVRAFVGPLMARAALRHLLPPTPLDVGDYTTRFLASYAATPPTTEP